MCQDSVDEIRDALATGAKRGRKADSHTSDVVREAVEQSRGKSPRP